MSLLSLGGLDLISFLIYRGKKGKCPRCNYPITEKATACTMSKIKNKVFHICPNCMQYLNWKKFKE